MAYDIYLVARCKQSVGEDMTCIPVFDGCCRGLAQALQHIDSMRSDQGQAVDQQEAALNGMFARDEAADQQSAKEMAALHEEQVCP